MFDNLKEPNYPFIIYFVSLLILLLLLVIVNFLEEEQKSYMDVPIMLVQLVMYLSGAILIFSNVSYGYRKFFPFDLNPKDKTGTLYSEVFYNRRKIENDNSVFNQQRLVVNNP